MKKVNEQGLSVQRRTLGVIILIAVIHGLIYVFVIPPWQHYDEPSHFEHAWLVASHKKEPDNSPIDITLHLQLFRSMLENDFYRGLPVPAVEDIQQGNRVLGLQYSQLTEPPLYYLMASLPMKLLLQQNLTLQLYGARLISLNLLIIAIIAIWGFTIEITGVGSPLRILVPMSAAMLPGFVDLMTAVNNDVGAVAVFSWFLWGSVRFIKKGWSYFDFTWVISTLVLCLFTKSTVYIAVPLFVLVVIFGSFREESRKLAWVIILGIAIVVFLFAVQGEDAAFWHRSTSQTIPTRVKIGDAPVGEFALQIDTSAGTTPSWLRPLNQPFSGQDVSNLAGKTMSMGAWIWVSSPPRQNSLITVRTPVLNIGDERYYEMVTVTDEPVFFAFQFNLPDVINKIWISIYPIQSGSEFTVYFDGLILAEGNYPVTEPPIFEINAMEGTWGGLNFENLIRNPSGENAWLSIRPEADNILAVILPDNARLSMYLASAIDWSKEIRYFRATLNNLLETFWGRFGWGHIPLIPKESYIFFGFLTLIGFAGMVLVLFQGGNLSKEIFVFLMIVLALAWGSVLLRGVIFIFTPVNFIPSARYAFPAISPTLLMLWMGWLGWEKLLGTYFKSSTIDHFRIHYIIAGLCFVIIDVVSIISILMFYEKL